MLLGSRAKTRACRREHSHRVADRLLFPRRTVLTLGSRDFESTRERATIWFGIMRRPFPDRAHVRNEHPPPRTFVSRCSAHRKPAKRLYAPLACDRTSRICLRDISRGPALFAWRHSPAGTFMPGAALQVFELRRLRGTARPPVGIGKGGRPKPLYRSR